MRLIAYYAVRSLVWCGWANAWLYATALAHCGALLSYCGATLDLAVRSLRALNSLRKLEHAVAIGHAQARLESRGVEHASKVGRA